MNRVLIIGYGSIGQRHARVLCAMKKIEKVYIFSSQKIKQTDKIVKVSGKSYLNLNVTILMNIPHANMAQRFLSKLSNEYPNTSSIVSSIRTPNESLTA